ncbi:MAG: metallophosphatase [Bacteroidetes bacterium]|nr:metallophosphatase [Bacteroidota bacterium]
MLTRRKFLKISTLSSVYALGIMDPLSLLAKEDRLEKLTILHTNDVHSRIDPFVGGKYDGMGGVAQRLEIIQSIRKSEKNVLLLDCGDIFQGTPYFNLYGGELEIKAMSQLGYDAGTLGNHDFDNGIEGFVKQMPHANFPFINGNYSFQDTLLEGKIAPYKIISKGNIKIGIIAVGIELKGLVPDKLFGNIRYEDPIAYANATAKFLKEEKKCDLVICLSHLGYKYDARKISDIILAKESKNIDIILGGHTHTFLNEPQEQKNAAEKVVLVNQVGFGGIILGRIDVFFDKNLKHFKNNSLLVKISK